MLCFPDQRNERDTGQSSSDTESIVDCVSLVVCNSWRIHSCLAVLVISGELYQYALSMCYNMRLLHDANWCIVDDELRILETKLQACEVT